MALPYQWQMRGERLKQMFGGMFGRGERRPQLCPACGALVGISATRCHQCGANLRFGLAAWSKGLSEFFGGHAPVTTALLIINVIMFAVSLIRSLKSGGGFSLFGGMSGVELQGVLQTQGCRVPIIFITAFPQESVRAQALNAGAICVLTKPFDGLTLIKYLEMALGKQGSGTGT